MYGCSNSIKCIQLSANRIGDDIKVNAERVDNSHFEIQAVKVGKNLSITAYSLADNKQPLEVYAHKIGSELSVTANIICTIGNVTIDYVPFLVKEGEFVLVDGRIFNVKSYGI
jgi:hypothetical protein